MNSRSPELQAKIEELRLVGNDSQVNLSDEIARLQDKSTKLTESIFKDLGAWQVSQLARHPQRPYTLDYLDNLFTDFDELRDTATVTTRTMKPWSVALRVSTTSR